MPGCVKIKIISARNLPIMDRSTFLTDAFVEIRFSNECFKTDVVKKSLNPQWNSDWIAFEVDDHQLQEETLQIRVLDHDTYSAHDSIGRVYIDLNTLLIRKKNRSINGWFPIYDTMHGIRGELNLILKADLFSDVSKFRQSSVGVQFFYSNCVPLGHTVLNLLGFVEELIIMDDPEHQWREKLRTSRASNETRQRLFSKLSGELQRKMGVKVLEMGGNSVIGYQLRFDLEGETGVVIRGIGTVAELSKLNLSDSTSPPTSPSVLIENKPNLINEFNDVKLMTSIKEEEMSVNQSLQSISNSFKRKLTEFWEFPFLTIAMPPPGFVQHFGSVVSVKSVKLLEKNLNEEQGYRNSWWQELRTEVVSHMRRMNCNAVLGYSENCIIYEDVCILIGCGTAVFLNINYNGLETISSETQLETESKASIFGIRRPLKLDIKLAHKYSHNESPHKFRCRLCHLPDNIEMLSQSITVMCQICGQAAVPEVIFSTSEIPEELEIKGCPTLVQARVCRPKKESKGELCAKEINDILPFLEYEMHYKLIQNISIKGLNALFGLKIDLCVGQNLIIAIATGTGVFLVGLPSPVLPKLNNLSPDGENLGLKLADFRMISITHLKLNTDATGYDYSKNSANDNNIFSISKVATNKTSNRNNELSKRLSTTDNVFIDTGELNIDYINSVIKESLPPPDIIMSTINFCQLNHNDKSPQMIFRFVRSGLLLNNVEGSSNSIGTVTSEKLDILMQDFNATLWMKLRKLIPCFISGIEYTFNVTDDNWFEVMCTGFVSTLKPISTSKITKRETTKNFKQFEEDTTGQTTKFLISPLSFVQGYNIEMYFGCLNFFFVRETTSLREFGGVSGFIQASLGEVQAVVASHTIAAGASALLSCHVNELILNYPSNCRQMNSAQCLINICGDMVLGHFVLDKCGDIS